MEAWAFEFKVSGVQLHDGMDAKFELVTSLESRVILDCQSFVQGMSVGQNSLWLLYLLEPNECEDFYGRINKSLRSRKQHCVIVDDIIQDDYTCP